MRHTYSVKLRNNNRKIQKLLFLLKFKIFRGTQVEKHCSKWIWILIHKSSRLNLFLSQEHLIFGYVLIITQNIRMIIVLRLMFFSCTFLCLFFFCIFFFFKFSNFIIQPDNFCAKFSIVNSEVPWAFCSWLISFAFFAFRFFFVLTMRWILIVTAMTHIIEIADALPIEVETNSWCFTWNILIYSTYLFN